MKFILILLQICFYFETSHAQPSIIPEGLLDPSLLSNQLPQNIADEGVKLIGLYGAHRPYSGASSIYSSNGFDFLIEATAIKLGPGFLAALKSNNIDTQVTEVPALPVAKISIRKAFNNKVDIGLSAFSFKGQTIYGGDFKYVLYEPDEGPTFAIRFGYTKIHVPLAFVENCSVYSPEIVASRRLDFAEPYIGIGGRFVEGDFTIPFPAIGPIPEFSITKVGKASTAYAFTGVYFRIFGAQGIRLGMEGSYDISGFHTMGLVLGIGF